MERFFNDSRAPLPVAYVSFPSAKDPSFEERCPGRATVEVITLVPYAWFRKWENKPWKKRGEEYEELKAKLAERMHERVRTELWGYAPDESLAPLEPFVLEPEDSGTKQAPVSYQAAAGAQPVFTGGRVIGGWESGPNGVWKTRVPQVAAGEGYFEQLYIACRNIDIPCFAV